MGYRDDLRLDQYELVQNALEQPELFAKYASEWADAVRDRDCAKDKLTVVRSEADQEIRENPSKFGWGKSDKAPTEAFIASAISTHPKVVESNNNYQEAHHSVNILMVAKEAFEQRGKMISIITQLFLSGYYSGNKRLDKGYQEVLPEVAKEAQNEGLGNSARLSRRVKNGE